LDFQHSHSSIEPQIWRLLILIIWVS